MEEIKRILIVDDEEPIRVYLRYVLNNAGYTTVLCDNGTTGMELFDSEDFDFVISDVVMPGKDGIQALMEMKSKKPWVKIVVMSGAASVGALLKIAGLFEADATLRKPFTKPDILGCLKTLSTAPKENAK